MADDKDKKKDNDNSEDVNGNGSGVPLLHQYDPRWANYPYNDGTVASSGCGPTSFAMIARWYGIDISPADATDFAANGYHVSEGTSYVFFADAAKNWGFDMRQATRDEVVESLKKGYPCIGAHGPGLFTYNGHFIVYAKLTPEGKLIVNDPNCNGGGPNDRGDDYQYDLDEVLNDNAKEGFVGFICLTSHDGKKPLLNDQSLGEKGTASGSRLNQWAKSSDTGFRVTPKGNDYVHIIKLPDKKTFCEPIYPDYITVSDTVPKWVLDNTINQQNADTANKEGKGIPDGDAPEKAPNGMHYSENDIKYLMENQKITREQAIEQLSKDERYTREVQRNKNGTFDVINKDDKKQ
jgi:hypothetical protein